MSTSVTIKWLLATLGILAALRGGHVPTIAYARICYCVFASVRREFSKAAPHAETLVSVARERGLPQLLANGTFLLGWAHWAGGQSTGEPMMRDGLLREMEIRPFEAFFVMLVAELEGSTSRVEEGLVTLQQHVKISKQTGQLWSEADMHRVRGDLLFTIVIRQLNKHSGSHSLSPTANMPRHSSFVPRPVSPASGASEASEPKPVIY